MQIKVNGEARGVAAVNVAELVAQLGLNPRQVAIEKNRVIVPRTQYADEPIRDGDEVEIVQFIGGG
ncbi:MAG: sulfur carrier protein ThiS [Proteobacteria bacterium]|nr:sulfur carrier protein ThiS [Pseudomonadota bacterium]